MMGRKRKERKDLPERMYFNNGAYYFVQKDGKWIWLSKDLKIALQKYADIVSAPVAGRMAEIMDGYLGEIRKAKPGDTFYKAPRTIQNNEWEMVPLKAAFGHMEPHEITPTQIYQYADERPRVAANREVALLSSVYKYAIRKGKASLNPCKQVSRNKEKARKRDVTDEQFQTVYSIAPAFIQCAMDLDRQTGLRLSDLLSLNEDDNFREEGIYIETGKTGKILIFTWTDELKATVERCRALRGNIRGIKRYLIANGQGQRYTADGFKTMWQRVMGKAVKAGVERFQFRDLRAVAAKKAQNPSELLGHDDPRITNKHYRRGARKVTPNK